MRTHLAAVLAASLVFTGSAITFAAQAKKPAATHAAAEKTAMGTVKSIDANKLVLKTKKGDMTFSLGSTKAENITTGSSVQVHYKSEGKDHIVTSLMPAAAPTTKK
jgi:hypothetical protein